MEDSRIVDMYLNRDEQAVACTQAQYGAYCGAVARRIIGDRQDAEECLNDVLYAAWGSIPPQEPNNLRTYLGKLTRETAIDRWRTKNRKKRVRSDVTVSLDEIGEMVSGGDLDAGNTCFGLFLVCLLLGYLTRLLLVERTGKEIPVSRNIPLLTTSDLLVIVIHLFWL